MNIAIENLSLIPKLLEDIELIKKALTTRQEKRWITLKEASSYLGYSKDRLYKLKNEVFIENRHFYKKGGKILFDRVALDAWVIKGDNNEATQAQRLAVDRLLSSIKKI